MDAQELIAETLASPAPRAVADVMAKLVEAADVMVATGGRPMVAWVNLLDFVLLVESGHFRWGGRCNDSPGLLVDGLGGGFESLYVLVRTRLEQGETPEMVP